MSEMKLSSMANETESLIGALAGVLNALTFRDNTVSITASGLMIRGADGKKIGKVTQVDGEYQVV